ncbi:MAG: hypothetical protein V1827_02795 [Candidatus Micrarchaeota archaeon]
MIDSILSLAWLLVVTFSLGFALTREKSLMSFGFGLAAFVILSTALDLVGIPLHWTVFLVIALAMDAYFVHRKELAFEMPRPDWILGAVLLLALINTYVYWQGATSYPWLEDDDPWGYAHDAKWVSIEQTYSVPYGGEQISRLSRLEPFPPGYSILIGVLHQMTVSLSDTLKFYNVLLIGSGLIFAFGFFSQITGNRLLALVATFFLLALPSFMNHFIWAQSLAIPLLFVAFFALEKAKNEQRYVLAAAAAIASIALTHPAVAGIFALLYASYALIQAIASGKEALMPIIRITGFAIALSCIFYVPVLLKFGLANTISGVGLTSSLVNIEDGQVVYQDDTSGNIVYGVSDFLFPQPQGKIDQQSGIGLAISALCVGGLFLSLRDMKKTEPWLLCAVVWFAICMLGVEGNGLPVKLFPHRFWVYLSIPVAMLAAHAYIQLDNAITGKKRLILAAVMVLSVLDSSAIAKYNVEMASWPPGAYLSSAQQVEGFAGMKTSLPADTMVFPLCIPDNRVIGFDMLTDMYDPDYVAFKKSAPDQSADQVYSFLAPRGYEYLIIDSSCLAMGEEKANAVLTDFIGSDKYDLAYSNGGFFLFRLG